MQAMQTASAACTALARHLPRPGLPSADEARRKRQLALELVVAAAATLSHLQLPKTTQALQRRWR